MLTFGHGPNPHRLWDLKTGQAIASLAKPDEGDLPEDLTNAHWPRAVVSADGSRVLVVSRSNKLAVWETAGGRLVAELPNPGFWVGDLSMNRDRTRIAIASMIMNVENGLTSPGKIVLWDTATGQHPSIVSLQHGVSIPLLNDAGTRLIYRQHGRVSHGIWEVGRGPISDVNKDAERGRLEAPIFIAGEPFALYAKGEQDSPNWSLDLWNLSTQEHVSSFPMVQTTRVAIAPGGRYVMLTLPGTRDFRTGQMITEGERVFFDMASRRKVPLRMPTSADGPSDDGLGAEYLFSADGERVAVMGKSGIPAAIWNIATGQAAGEAAIRRNWVAGSALSPNGVVAASWRSWDHVVQVHDVATGSVIGQTVALPGLIDTAIFSANGQRLLVRDDSRNVTIWDLDSRRTVLTGGIPPALAPASLAYLFAKPRGQSGQTPSVPAFQAVLNPDGTLLATPGREQDEVAVVTEVDTGRVLFHLRSPRQSAGAVFRMSAWERISSPPLPESWTAIWNEIWQFSAAASFSPDGKTLAVAMGDGLVLLWDTSSGELSRQFGPPERVTAGIGEFVLHARGGLIARGRASFSPDGGHLAIGDFLGRMLVWDTRSGTHSPDLAVPTDRFWAEMSYSPDRQRVMFGDRVQNMKSGAILGNVRLGRAGAIVGATGWTRDGRPMAVICETGERPGPAKTDTAL